MKFSLKSAVIVIIAALVYMVLEDRVGINTAFEHIQITSAYPFLCFMSVVCGPVSGGMTAFLGTGLVFATEWYLDVPLWIANVVLCVLVGSFTRDIDIQNGFFEKVEILRFNLVQALAHLFCWVLLRPGITSILNRSPFFPLMKDGIWNFLSNAFSTMLLGTLFLLIYARSRFNASNFYRN